MSSHKSYESVAITGGCGLYGYHLIRRILELEPACSIAVLDVDVTANNIPGVTYHECDLSDASRTHAIFAALRPPPRAVFHLACPPSILPNDQHFWRVNVEGTRHLLAASRQAGVQALLYTSSLAVVHDNESDLIDADETMPLLKPPRQENMYTLSKALAEEAVLAANRDGGMRTAALRPCTMFGPRNPGFLARIVALGRARMARFRMGADNPWDFVHVANLVHACHLAAQGLLRAAETPDAPLLPPGERVEGEAFNVSNDERVAFWDFTLAVAAAVGEPVAEGEVVKVPRAVALLVCLLSVWGVWLFSLGRRQSSMVREGVVFAYITRTLDISKSQRVLGYRPVVSLRDGIRESVEWYRANDKKQQ